MQITGTGWSGGVMVLDEWAQACEHLLLSTGTALGDSRRVAVLQTLAEQLDIDLPAIPADRRDVA